MQKAEGEQMERDHLAKADQKILFMHRCMMISFFFFFGMVMGA